MNNLPRFNAEAAGRVVAPDDGTQQQSPVPRSGNPGHAAGAELFDRRREAAPVEGSGAAGAAPSKAKQFSPEPSPEAIELANRLLTSAKTDLPRDAYNEERALYMYLWEEGAKALYECIRYENSCDSASDKRLPELTSAECAAILDFDTVGSTYKIQVLQAVCITHCINAAIFRTDYKEAYEFVQKLKQISPLEAQGFEQIQQHEEDMCSVVRFMPLSKLTPESQRHLCALTRKPTWCRSIKNPGVEQPIVHPLSLASRLEIAGDRLQKATNLAALTQELDFLKAQAEAGIPHANYMLFHYYSAGRHNLERVPDTIIAYEYLEQAVAQGHVVAIFKLGIMQLYGRTPDGQVNIEAGRMNLKCAADKGLPVAATQYAMHLLGLSCFDDALLYAKKAAYGHDSPASDSTLSSEIYLLSTYFVDSKKRDDYMAGLGRSGYSLDEIAELKREWVLKNATAADAQAIAERSQSFYGATQFYNLYDIALATLVGTSHDSAPVRLF